MSSHVYAYCVAETGSHFEQISVSKGIKMEKPLRVFMTKRPFKCKSEPSLRVSAAFTETAIRNAFSFSKPDF